MREAFLLGVAFVVGSIIGSFLNACIHRLPRGVSLNEPTRSFCPSCGVTIPWYQNLPIVSWILLRGKCAHCSAPISPRYLLVEILTALLFTALAWHFGLPLALPYAVFTAGLVAATFIDIEHFIIPDVLSLGGIGVGLISALLFPAMFQTESRWLAGAQSLAGAAVGFGLVWLIVEGGKLAFGRKRWRLKQAEPVTWIRDHDEADLQVGEETMKWVELFPRETDQLVLRGRNFQIDGENRPEPELRFSYQELLLPGEPRKLDHIDRIQGVVTELVFPREAMGFGDVKMMAGIGAFLGWQAAFFCIAAGSIVGSVFGVVGLLVARDRSGVRLPFGPFLAIGALLWLFGGRDLVDWYFSLYR